MEGILYLTATGDFSGELDSTSFLDYALAYFLCSYVEHKIPNGHAFDPFNFDALLDRGGKKDPKGMARIKGILEESNSVQLALKVP